MGFIKVLSKSNYRKEHDKIYRDSLNGCSKNILKLELLEDKFNSYRGLIK